MFMRVRAIGSKLSVHPTSGLSNVQDEVCCWGSKACWAARAAGRGEAGSSAAGCCISTNSGGGGGPAAVAVGCGTC